MRRISALLLLALVPACSAKKDGTGTNVADLAAFCSEWATRACNDTVVGSCSATSPGACIQAQQTFCESLVPAAKYSSKNADACLDAVREAYSDGQLTADERNVVLRLGAPCDKVVSGKGAKEAACTQDSDCNRDDDLACVKKYDGSGQCEVPNPTAVMGGNDCSAPDAVCTVGYHCGFESSCVQNNVKEGQPCSDVKPCGAGLRCGKPSGQISGADAGAEAGAGAASSSDVCIALVKVSPCATDTDCESGICAVGSGASSGRCTTSAALSSTDRICDALH
jgi:hypothetical protein